MFQSLRLQSFGPHADTKLTLNADGVTTISGGSTTGKSYVAHAICGLLFGLDADGDALDHIRDDAASLQLAGVTTSGTLLTRTRTPKGASTRGMKKKDADEQLFTAEEPYRAALGKIGANAEIGRIIVAPRQWTVLAEKECGRPLRDLVMSLLPAGDVRAVVRAAMGDDWRDGDAVTEAAAKESAAAANKRRDETKGALDAARTPLVAPAALSVDGDPKAAKAVLAAASTWEDYDRRSTAYDGAKARVAAAIAARDEWRDRAAKVGTRPTFDAAGYRVWEAECESAFKAKNDADRKLADVKANLARANGELDRAVLPETADDWCPTCGRDGWAHAADARAQAVAANAAAVKAAEDALAAFEKAEKRAALAADDYDATRAKGAAFAAAREALQAFDAATRALGSEPGVPAPPDMPAVPMGSRPTADDVAHARAVIDHAAQAEGAAKAFAEAEKRHAATLAAAEEAAAKAEAEAKRQAKLVAACRQAPTTMANAQKEAIGDLGPVTLEFPAKLNKSSPEIIVKVNGKHWRKASEGELIHADMHFRAGLRRLAGLGALPIVVDSAQSWSKGWADAPKRAILLHTSAGELRVSGG